jgi:hypothetical protein
MVSSGFLLRDESGEASAAISSFAEYIRGLMMESTTIITLFIARPHLCIIQLFHKKFDTQRQPSTGCFRI